MNKFIKRLGIALTLLGAGTSVANATSTIIYHSDNTKDLVVTDDSTGRTVIYRDFGDGTWHEQGYHGEVHPHWDVVNRRTGPEDSVGDYRKPREPGTVEPKEPPQPRQHLHNGDAD